MVAVGNRSMCLSCGLPGQGLVNKFTQLHSPREPIEWDLGEAKLWSSYHIREFWWELSESSEMPGREA